MPIITRITLLAPSVTGMVLGISRTTLTLVRMHMRILMLAVHSVLVGVMLTLTLWMQRAFMNGGGSLMKSLSSVVCKRVVAGTTAYAPIATRSWVLIARIEKKEIID